jgi:hypothetical protein
MADTKFAPRPQTRSLTALVDNKLLTPEAKNWLIMATDPAHDYTIELAGMPDMDVSPSVVQVVKKSFSLTCPGGIASGNWDANIVCWPFIDKIKESDNTGGHLHNNGAWDQNTPSFAKFDIGGVTALCAASGNATYGNANAGQIFNVDTGLSLDTAGTGFGSDTMRVIGYGFEVQNATAEIYKQGMVTVYSQPTPSERSKQWIETGTSASGNWVRYGGGTAIVAPMPPGDLATALLLTTAKQWEARAGNYNVATLIEDSNPPMQCRSVGACYLESSRTSSTTGTYDGVLTQFQTYTAGTGSFAGPILNYLLPYNMTGAYYTGLSHDSILNITWYVYLEKFPDWSDTNLVTMAKPSPGLNTMAMDLYGQALRDMPAGVPFRDNPLGEWFQDVVANIAENVSPWLKAAGVVHPGFGIAGNVADFIAKSARRTNSTQGYVTPNPGTVVTRPKTKNKPKPRKAKPASNGNANRTVTRRAGAPPLPPGRPPGKRKV